jgi:hypothetical protein
VNRTGLVGGLGIGYALARISDRVWPRSPFDDPRTEVRDALPLIAVGLAVMFAVHYQQHAVGVVFIKNCVFSAPISFTTLVITQNSWVSVLRRSTRTTSTGFVRLCISWIHQRSGPPATTK